MHWGTLEHIRTHKWEVLGHTGNHWFSLGSTLVKFGESHGKKTVCKVIADIFLFVFVSQRSAIPLAVTSTPPT